MKSAKKPARKNKQTENVEVFCRIRPVQTGTDTCVKKVSDNTLCMTNVDPKTGCVLKEVRYSFQKVFDETSRQDEVFERVAYPLVDNLLHGKNGLLFAYGVTSSGKTHTMEGTSRDRGLMHRCLECLFNSIRPVQAKKYVFKPDKMNGFDVQGEADALLERQAREITPRLLGRGGSRLSSSTPNISTETSCPKVSDLDYDSSYSVFVTYVQVYNNYVYDLLEELPLDAASGYKSPTSKNVREDSEHHMYVSAVVEVEVMSAEDAVEVFQRGQKRRKVAATTLNHESSRSHSIFSLRLVQAPLDSNGDHVLLDKKKVLVSQLSLVDLAGSERTARTNSNGDRLKEAGNINQSLMVLRSCIEALRENQKNSSGGGSSSSTKLVPYRDSRITLLFKSFFEGEGKVTMVVCVNPKTVEYDETMNVMKFAELTQEVQIAKAQVTRPDTGFTPGRRQANLQNRDVDITNHKVMVYSLGPPFPSLVPTGPHDDKTTLELLTFLRDRQSNRASLLTDVDAKQDSFRGRLVGMERELDGMRDALAKNQQLLEQKEEMLVELNKKSQEKDQAIEALTQRMHMYEQERVELKKEVGEKSWAILQEKLKVNNLRMDFNAKLDMNARQFNQNIEQAKRKLKEEAGLKMRGKQQKLDLLKSIINDSSNPPTPVPDTPRSRYARNEAATTTAPNPFKVPSNPSAPTIASTNRNRARSPPPVKPKPLSIHRRRSKSTENLWISHRPDPVGPSTPSILHPKLKTLKSVTRITEKELKDKEANKYLLTSQGYDSQGEFATKFVKGDIKTSVGGGTQVVFTGVEVVKNKAAGSNKRRSPTPPPSEGEWTDVETRCHVGLDGHAKRPKCSEI